MTKNPYKRRTKDGSPRWDAVVYIPAPRDEQGKPTGKMRLLTKTFRREADAKKWLTAQRSLKDNGRSPVVTKETLGQYLADWLTVHAGQVRAVTVASYRASIKRWIDRPRNGGRALGTLRLKDVTVHTFDQLYRDMAAQGLTRQVGYLHGILKRALKDAVKKEILTRNPAEFATVPKANAHGEAEAAEAVGQAMTQAQANAFLKAAATDRLAGLWYVLLTGGLRPSEAFGLKWPDVDFDRGEIHIRQTLTREVDSARYPQGWMLAKPKTNKSHRTVPLPAITMQVLRAWRTEQKKERFAVGPEWQEHHLVFTTPLGTPLDLGNVRAWSFRRVMERAGLGTYGEPPTKKPGQPGPQKQRPFTPAFRIYDLRHSCASLLLADGEDLLVVSRRLGHSTIKLTADTYSHITQGRAEQAAGRFDRMFGTG